MKSVFIDKYGGPEVLEYGELPVPEPSAGKILVEVYATAVNNLEVIMASGKRKEKMPVDFPWIPGMDFAGRIDYIEKESERLKKGDEVYGKCLGGTYAEYLVVEAHNLARMPANLSFTEAASVPHVGLTAWQAVFAEGNVMAGERVLILGAGGAVGSYATQLVKLAGGYIFAVDSAEKRTDLLMLGADIIIDYKSEDFTMTATDIDLVLDFTGGESAAKALGVIRRGGRMVSTVVEPDQNQAAVNGVTAHYFASKPDPDNLTELTLLIENGKIRPDVGLVLPLSEARKAWEIYTHKRQPDRPFAHGQIVLSIK